MKRVLSLFLLTVVGGSLWGCGEDAANAPKPSGGTNQNSSDQGSGTKDKEPAGSGTKPTE